MRLLIDANILLDVLQDREPFVRDSMRIWKMCETGAAEGYISALTAANLVYVMRKQLQPEMVEKVLQTLQLIFRIADLKEADLIKASELRWSDFEDAVQSVTAQRIQAVGIITRNTRDFKESRVPAFTPAEYLT